MQQSVTLRKNELSENRDKPLPMFCSKSQLCAKHAPKEKKMCRNVLGDHDILL